MSRIQYGQLVDPDGPVQSNLDAMFADVQSAVTARFEEEDFQPSSIQRRHLKNQTRVFLQKTWRNGLQGTTAQAPYAAFKELPDSRLRFDLGGITAALNRTKVAHQTIIVNALLRTNGSVHGWATSTGVHTKHDASHFALGYSTNGTTWTLFPSTQRSCHGLNGGGFDRTNWGGALFDPQIQGHYITGAGWVPPTEAYMHRVVLTAALGGGADVKKLLGSSGVLYISVFMNHDIASPGYPNVSGHIEANVRKVLT